jgi:hypothetical protein
MLKGVKMKFIYSILFYFILFIMPKLKLLDWIKENEDKLSWDGLSANSAAIEMLAFNPDKN